MSNLFFVHTPLSLIVAQQIIKMEGLQNNIMLLGYVGGNKHYLDICNILKIESMWNSIEIYPTIAGWAGISKRHILNDMVKALKNYRRIRSIIKRYNVDTLYLVDMNNYSTKFSSRLFSKQGLKICIFEEGASHYGFETHPQHLNIIINRILSFFVDIFYFLPIFHLWHAKWCFVNDLPFEGMHIDVRYSLRPHYYTEPYDKIIQAVSLLSPNIEECINEDINGNDCNQSVIVMTTPLWQGVCDEKLYLECIDNYCKRIDNKLRVFLKFHPSEVGEQRNHIQQVFERNNISVYPIGLKYNLPIEIYLQKVRFQTICTFYSSSRFYNGYLYPLTQYHSLLPDFYNMCKLSGNVKQDRLEALESFMAIDNRLDSEEKSKSKYLGRYITG